MFLRRHLHFAVTCSAYVALASTVAAVVLSACSRQQPNPTSVVERFTAGDTSVVRNVSGSEWGDSISLVEELSIGVAIGNEQYMFGNIGLIHEHRNGNVLIVDRNKVRMYDSTGKFIRCVGRAGGGPGEFMWPNRLGELPDGRIMVYDALAARVSVFSAAGDPLTTLMVPPTPMSGDDTDPLPVTASGDFFINAAQHRRLSKDGPRSRSGYVRISSSGVVQDTLLVFSQNPEPGVGPGMDMDEIIRRIKTPKDYFAPSEHDLMLPSGDVVHGWSSAYSFLVRTASGKLMRVEKVQEPIAVASEERVNLEQHLRTGGGSGAIFDIVEGDATVMLAPGERPGARSSGPIVPPPPVVGPTKPAYRAIRPGADGRIWVQPHVRAEYRAPTDPVEKNNEGQPIEPLKWLEPHVYDVFAPDGALLGRIRLGDRDYPMFMRGDRVWVLRRGESDESFALRYRIVRRRN